MMYEPQLKKTMLVVLEDKVTSIVNCIFALLDEGYIPNKNKSFILTWCSIVLNEYENVDILSDEQKDMLCMLYNKVLKL